MDSNGNLIYVKGHEILTANLSYLAEEDVDEISDGARVSLG
jgi:hypothetical protein